MRLIWIRQSIATKNEQHFIVFSENLTSASRLTIQQVGYVRRETQRAHYNVPEGECDGGGVGEDDERIRISACASGRATPLRNQNDMVRYYQAEKK